MLIEKYRRKNKARIGDVASTLVYHEKFVKEGEAPKESDTPATALMAAAHYGHDVLVRALYNAHPESVKLKSASASAKQGGAAGGADDDDALLLATRQGHLQVVRAAVAWPLARTRLEDAQALAQKFMEEARAAGNEDGVQLYDKIRRELQKPSLVRRKTDELRALTASDKERRVVAADTPMAQLRERIATVDLKSLAWIREQMFDGQIVPPRPNEDEIHQRRTPLGPLILEHGVVVQHGPFNSVWLRVGCVRRVHWNVLWNYLKLYVTVALEEERKKKRSGAVYCAISVRSMQAVDFAWLADQGFRFHHYRPPGHGMTPLAEDADGAGAAAVSEADLMTAELVYYCWPASTPDMVPTYATSIEGVSGLVFSLDETKLLMVWERGAWNTPGGAVNAGESKIDALERELYEEVALRVDRTWEGMRFLGGWQQQCARDNLINDNFSVFAVRCESEYVKPDGVEITEAHWLPWRSILQAWRDMGRPTSAKRVKMPEIHTLVGRNLGADKETVALLTLQWLDTFEQQRGFCVKLKTDVQGPKRVTKATFTAAI